MTHVKDALREARIAIAAGSFRSTTQEEWPHLVHVLREGGMQEEDVVRAVLQATRTGCTHEEIEFSGETEFESGALVFHVNCRACGRSGSATVTNDGVLW